MKATEKQDGLKSTNLIMKQVKNAIKLESSMQIVELKIMFKKSANNCKN